VCHAFAAHPDRIGIPQQAGPRKHDGPDRHAFAAPKAPTNPEVQTDRESMARPVVGKMTAIPLRFIAKGGFPLIFQFKRELSVTAALLVLLLLLAWFAPLFYTGPMPLVILVSCAPLLVAAAGMTVVILVRHIDISIGSQFSICGVAAGLLAKAGLPMPLVAALTMLLGSAFGAINGGLVAGLNLPSIVVTLATLFVLQQGLMLVGQGELIKGIPGHFQWFGLGQEAGQCLILAIAVVVLSSFAWGLRFLAAGRMVYAVGSDAEAARLAGIRPKRIVFAAFVIMGGLAGLAALLHSVRFPDVDPKAGELLELQVIAAVVVGGVAVSGGRGTMLGAAIGVLLLTTLGPALEFLGIGAWWDKAVQGVIILLAVAADGLTFARRKHAGTAVVRP
jgi:rhamnose transport system permease protein